MKCVFVIGALASLAGCFSALSAQDATSLHEAQQTALRAYEMTIDAGPDGSSLAANAMVRGSYCAIDAVLRRQDAGPIDSKGEIVCGVQK